MLNWPSSFPQWLEHSAVKVSSTLTVPDHHIAPSVAVLAARGCTRVTSAGQAGGERWRQVTNGKGGGSKREAGWRRVLARSNALVTLNALWWFSAATPEAISCIWHMHLRGTSDMAVWLHCDSSLRTLVACQTPASGVTNAPGTECCELTCHMLAKESNEGPNNCLRSCVKCNFHTFLHVKKQKTDDAVCECLHKVHGQNKRNTWCKWTFNSKYKGRHCLH